MPAQCQIHFEVHVFESERWIIDYVCQDEEEALVIAKDLLRRPGIAGVRVIKEIHNPVKEVTATRTIFEEMREVRRAWRTIPVQHLPLSGNAGLPPAAPAPKPVPVARRTSSRLASGPRRGPTLSVVAAGLSLAVGISGTVTVVWLALVS
ncbi:hypothetical protein HRbin40_01608 [bacterium HR40]|nr:hypothetical protein HRbin40_01608 [bacterium HR40]